VRTLLSVTVQQINTDGRAQLVMLVAHAVMDGLPVRVQGTFDLVTNTGRARLTALPFPSLRPAAVAAATLSATGAALGSPSGLAVALGRA
jgi:hypothetical protein